MGKNLHDCKEIVKLSTVLRGVIIIIILDSVLGFVPNPEQLKAPKLMDYYWRVSCTKIAELYCNCH